MSSTNPVDPAGHMHHAGSTNSTGSVGFADHTHHAGLTSLRALRRIAGKLGGALLVVALVTLIAFGLSYLSPTDAAVKSFGAMGVVPTDAQLAAKRAEMGLDQPFLQQYVSWVAGIFQGDLGTSYRNGQPVVEVLFDALPYTVSLSVAALALTLLVSLPAGLWAAYRKGGVFDQVVRIVTYAFNAMPAFFVALLLLYVLAARLGWLTILSTRDFAGMVMPTLALAVPLSAWFSRQVRAYALEQLSQPYIEGLRSRGVGEARILWVHVMRNMAVPVLTLVGVSFGMLLGGSAIVESIFHWPGLGFESIEAVGHRDYPFVAAYALTMAVVYLLVNALVDFSYRFVDPRTRTAGTRTAGTRATDTHSAGSNASGATAPGQIPAYATAADSRSVGEAPAGRSEVDRHA